MLQISPIPALSDNYIWLIREGDEVIIVDPSEANHVKEILAKYHLQPKAILLTHNHQDHTGGVYDLCDNYTDLVVFGPCETMPFNHQTVYDGDRFSLLGHQFEVIKSAGHTAEHISYLMDMEYLFCGDSLFSGGCGRVFTGDYQAQFETLQRFKSLPDIVQIYAGHEYTLSNLKFAETVLPESCGVLELIEVAQMKREQNRPTLPSTIAVEMQINPFLRAKNLEEFILLRQQKDQF